MIFDKCKTILEYIVGILMLAILVIIFSQIVSRFIFNNPIIWSEELSKFIMMWMVFMGMPLAIKRGNHLKVTLNIQNKFSPFGKVVTNIILDTLVIIAWVLITKFGYEYAVSLKLIPALTFPLKKIWVFLCIPVSGVLTVLFSTEKIIREIKGYLSFKKIKQSECNS